MQSKFLRRARLAKPRALSGLATAFIVISFVVAAGARCAHAEILAFGSYPRAIGVTNTEKPIPLRPNGSTAITFKTTEANTRVVVTFNTVCYVQSYSNFGGLGKLRIRITIDGAETSPQTGGAESGLCSAENTRTGYGSHSRQGSIVVREAGTHTLRVLAIRDEPAYNGTLYSSSILIQD